MVKIISNVEKVGRKKVINIQIDEDDSIVQRNAIKAYDKYDKNDPTAVDKVEHNREMLHNIWTLLHPS